jgi:hypothetical protein
MAALVATGVILFAASMHMALKKVDTVLQAQLGSRNATVLEARAEAVRNRQLTFVLATEAKYTQLLGKVNSNTKSNGEHGSDSIYTEGGIDDPHGFLGSMPYDLGRRANTVTYLQNAGPAHSRFVAATDMKYDMEWVIQIAKSYGAEFGQQEKDSESKKRPPFSRYSRISAHCEKHTKSLTPAASFCRDPGVGQACEGLMATRHLGCDQQCFEEAYKVFCEKSDVDTLVEHFMSATLYVKGALTTSVEMAVAIEKNGLKLAGFGDHNFMPEGAPGHEAKDRVESADK